MADGNIKRRLTKQKTAILEYLRSTKSHPDAEKVYNTIKRDNPNISLSTVYRNLSQMADDGIILRLSAETKSDHFDADTSFHHHFICNSCGKISDVYCTDLIKPDTDVGTVTSCSVYFYGICKECEKRKK